MTNIDEITIFDEIVNCGILEEDTILNLGAGHSNGKFLETLREYNGTFEEGKVIAVDSNSSKVKMLTKKFKNESISLIENPLQDYLENEPTVNDWTILTGVFDNNFYENQQYDFVTSVVDSSIQLSNKGVIFTIKENISESFKYSMIYFFTHFSNIYQRFTVKKFNDGNYIFCIFK